MKITIPEIKLSPTKDPSARQAAFIAGWNIYVSMSLTTQAVKDEHIENPTAKAFLDGMLAAEKWLEGGYQARLAAEKAFSVIEDKANLYGIEVVPETEPDL